MSYHYLFSAIHSESESHNSFEVDVRQQKGEKTHSERIGDGKLHLQTQKPSLETLKKGKQFL